MAVLPMLSFCICLGDGFLPGLVDNEAGMETTTPNDRLEQQRRDAGLATRSVKGDREAFHELTVRYYRPVCAFLHKRVQQADVVEDLAQETFLEAYRSLKSLARPEQFSTWLFGIARNRCGKWLRRRRPVLFAASDPPDVATVPFVSDQEELEEQHRLLARLEVGLAGLPEETRQILDLKHRQGKTCEQIAGELGRPAGTIKSLLSRAYKVLRERIGPEGESP